MRSSFPYPGPGSVKLWHWWISGMSEHHYHNSSRLTMQTGDRTGFSSILNIRNSGAFQVFHNATQSREVIVTEVSSIFFWIRSHVATAASSVWLLQNTSCCKEKYIYIVWAKIGVLWTAKLATLKSLNFCNCSQLKRKIEGPKVQPALY